MIRVFNENLGLFAITNDFCQVANYYHIVKKKHKPINILDNKDNQTVFIIKYHYTGTR